MDLADETATKRPSTLMLAASSLGLTVLMLAPVLFTADYYWGSGTDLQGYQYPLRNFAFSWLRQGVWPLFNPYIFNGIPSQTGVHSLAYPLTVLGLVLPTGWEIKITVALHLALAHFSMALLLRAFRLSFLAALLGGTIYALGGFPIAHLFAGHIDITTTFAYFPLVFVCFEYALRYRGLGWTVLAAGVLGLMLLTGHYHVVYLSLFGIVGFTFLRMLLGSAVVVPAMSARHPFLREDRYRLGEASVAAEIPILATGRVPFRERLTDLGQWALRLSLLGMGSGLLVAFQLLPLSEVLLFSNRSTHKSYEFAVSSGVPAINWLTYLAPDFFGGTRERFFWAEWSPWEGQGYLGVASILLMGVALSLGSRRQWILLVAMIGACTALALGEQTPLFRMYYQLDPFIGRFRVPSRFLLPVTLFAAFVAAYGFHLWLTGEPHRARSRKLLFGLGGTLALFLGLMLWVLLLANGPEGSLSAFLQKTAASDVLAPQELLRFLRSQALFSLLLALTTAALLLWALVIRSARGRIAVGVAVFAVLGVDLFVFAKPKLGTKPPSAFGLPPEVLASVKESAGFQRLLTMPSLRAINDGAAAGISHVGGYDTLIDARYNHAVNLAMGYPEAQQLMLMTLFDYGPFWLNQGVSFLLSDRPLEEMPPATRERFAGFSKTRAFATGLFLYNNPEALPRAYVARRVELAPSIASARELLTRSSTRGTLYWARNQGEAPSELRPFLDSPVTSTEPLPGDEVRITALTPNEISMEAFLAAPGLIVETDAPYPGWSAQVDGEERPLLWVDGGLHRAVPVEAGKHRVVLSYWPSMLSTGLWVSVPAWLALFAYLASGFRRQEAKSA